MRQDLEHGEAADDKQPIGENPSPCLPSLTTPEFLAGRVMSEAEASAQIELDTGKRVKVKSANILLRFEQPAPLPCWPKPGSWPRPSTWTWPGSSRPRTSSALPTWRATAGRQGWSGPSSGSPAVPARGAALLRRAGRASTKKAPEETVKAALLGIERKRQQALQIEAWAAELVAGQCPAPVRDQIYKILCPGQSARVQPVEASRQVSARRWTQRNPAAPSPALSIPLALLECSLSVSPGRQPGHHDELPLENGKASRSTTPAYHRRRRCPSRPGHGTVTFGVHIAAPACANQPDCAWIRSREARCLHMPGQTSSCIAGRWCRLHVIEAATARRCPSSRWMDQLRAEDCRADAAGTRAPSPANPAPRQARWRDHRRDAPGEAPADCAFAPELALPGAPGCTRRRPRGGAQSKSGASRMASNATDCHERTAPPTGDETVEDQHRPRGSSLT